MDSGRRFLAPVAAMALVVLACCDAMAQSGEGAGLIVGSELDYPPLAIVRDDGQPDGFSVELIKAIADEMDLDIEIRVQPWGDLLEQARQGEIDILPNVALSPERQAFLDFTVPHAIQSAGIFVRRNSDITGLGDLSDRWIIVMAGDAAHEYMLRQGFAERLITVDSLAQGAEMLAAGQADCMVAGRLMGLQTLNVLGIKRVKVLKHPLPGSEQKFCIAVPKGRSELLAKLNEGLAIVKANGRYDEIYERWLGVYEPRQISTTEILGYVAAVLSGCALILLTALLRVRRLNRRIKRQMADLEAMERRLRRAATTDGLTGLPNRHQFCQRLGQAIGQSRAEGEYRFAVMFLDFDHFKTINDSLGHDAGDLLLKDITQRLLEAIRCSKSLKDHTGRHMIGRFGGDEFVVLLDAIGHTRDAVFVAESILARLSRPYEINGHDIRSSVSIGIVVSDQIESRSVSCLLRDADTAMYQAKQAGRATWKVFDESMQKKARDRLVLESDLRRALSRNELFLVYQPIVCLRNNRIKGYEALVRWNHPERGLVNPNDFIPLAEETGLIIDIGHWVLQEACQQFRLWQQNAGPGAPQSISVNLSRNQLEVPNLTQRIHEVLVDADMPAEALHLEVTETAVMQDVERAARILKQIKAVGVKLDMDDFGTGHSSLACLHQLPFDVLKIDRSFIVQMERGRDYAALLHAVTSLACNLKIQVVAEGVESLAQVAALQSLECDFAQGYLFSRPLPADDVPGFVLPSDLPGADVETVSTSNV